MNEVDFHRTHAVTKVLVLLLLFMGIVLPTSVQVTILEMEPADFDDLTVLCAA